jgi:hypothetical protein
LEYVKWHGFNFDDQRFDSIRDFFDALGFARDRLEFRSEYVVELFEDDGYFDEFIA